MSKKTKTTRPKREKKKVQKPARKPAKPRRVPSRVAAPAPAPAPAEKVPEREPEPTERYLIAVRLDGTPNVKPPEELTLDALRMRTRFSAVLLRDNPSVRGMLQRVKDHITWAEAKKEDVQLLLSSRAETSDGLGITDKFVKERIKLRGIADLISAIYAGKVTLRRLREMGVKPIFRLHPPRGGFARSSKRPAADGGELGYRKDGLHGLLAKMC